MQVVSTLDKAILKLQMMGYTCIYKNDWAIIFKQGDIFGFYNAYLNQIYHPQFEYLKLTQHFMSGIVPSSSKNYKRDKQVLFVKTKKNDLMARYKPSRSIDVMSDKSEVAFLQKDSKSKTVINYLGKKKHFEVTGCLGVMLKEVGSDSPHVSRLMQGEFNEVYSDAIKSAKGNSDNLYLLCDSRIAYGSDLRPISILMPLVFFDKELKVYSTNKEYVESIH